LRVSNIVNGKQWAATVGVSAADGVNITPTHSGGAESIGLDMGDNFQVLKLLP
jgi:hypothetical protein